MKPELIYLDSSAIVKLVAYEPETAALLSAAVIVSMALTPLAPGDYAILALDEGERLEYDNPEVLNPYLSDAEHVSVQPHGTVMRR